MEWKDGKLTAAVFGGPRQLFSKPLSLSIIPYESGTVRVKITEEALRWEV